MTKFEPTTQRVSQEYIKWLRFQVDEIKAFLESQKDIPQTINTILVVEQLHLAKKIAEIKQESFWFDMYDEYFLNGKSEVFMSQAASKTREAVEITMNNLEANELLSDMYVDFAEAIGIKRYDTIAED